MVTQLDLKKDLKYLYQPSGKVFSMVDVPPMNFLMIDGRGDPNTAQEYKDALEVLYGAAYTLKFTFKKGRGIDYPVMALEGLWWSDDMNDFGLGRRDDWQWTMMIMQPDIVTQSDVDAALAEVQRKKNPAALSKIRFERYAEGLSAQILYIGPYSGEGPTIIRLHDFIHESGCERSGKHHEIYLGDPRRTAPEKWKTVIRQPARRVAEAELLP